MENNIYKQLKAKSANKAEIPFESYERDK